MANREEAFSCAPSVESMQEFEVYGQMDIMDFYLTRAE
jgi:hypothetical protein